MNIVENIREGMRAIKANLLRTVLTALIIAIGITALVGILTAVDSIKYSLNSTMATLGASSFEIQAKGYNNRYSHGGVHE
ncbi:MAG: ABC transporter permease, partial [Chitinophagaceae bacterium]